MGMLDCNLHISLPLHCAIICSIALLHDFQEINAIQDDPLIVSIIIILLHMSLVDENEKKKPGQAGSCQSVHDQRKSDQCNMITLP